MGVALGAHAAPSAPLAPSGDKRNAQAAGLFQQGKYREAAEIYAQLRDESGNAKYSCNLGLCYGKMGFLEPAIETVRHCLDNATLGAVTRADYEALLAKLEAQRQGGAAAVPPTEVAPLPVPAPVVPIAPVVPVAPAAPELGAAPAYPAPAMPEPPAPPIYAQPAYPAPAEAPAYPQPAPYAGPPPPAPVVPDARKSADEDRGERRVPFGSYAAGAIGLVGGGMGIALILHRQAIQQELDGGMPADADRQLLEDDKSRASKGATAAFVVGGLGLTAAIVWAIVAPSYSKPKLAGLPLNVAIGPGEVGLSGRF
jgi:hypothetical protein